VLSGDGKDGEGERGDDGTVDPSPVDVVDVLLHCSYGGLYSDWGLYGDCSLYGHSVWYGYSVWVGARWARKGWDAHALAFRGKALACLSVLASGGELFPCPVVGINVGNADDDWSTSGDPVVVLTCMSCMCSYGMSAWMPIYIYLSLPNILPVLRVLQLVLQSVEVQYQ
jgi:hypothetical protein